MSKLYFIELKITAVVAAENETDACHFAKNNIYDICSNGQPVIDRAVEVSSLEHLKQLNTSWNGECLPFNGDGKTKICEFIK